MQLVCGHPPAAFFIMDFFASEGYNWPMNEPAARDWWLC